MSDTTRTPSTPSTFAQPGGLGLWAGAWRQSDYWITVYRRTWRASIVSSFASPLLYVVAMGVVLGGFIAGDPDRLEGATSYLAFVVPGLIASHAMQVGVGETTYPVMGMIKWHKTYYSMLATPLEVPHLVLANLMFVAVRLAAICAVFGLVMAPFGVYASWWGPLLAWPVQVLTGLACATLTFAYTVRVTSESAFGVLFRIVVFPLALFSGAFFPVANLGDVGAAVARVTPLWQGVNASRMLSVDHVDWALLALNVGVLAVLLAVGWVLSVRGLARRLAQ